jgi:hypothetical protein
MKLIEEFYSSNLFNFAANTIGIQMCNTVLLGEIEVTGDFFLRVSDTLLNLWLVAGKWVQWSRGDPRKNRLSVSRSAWYRERIGISIQQYYNRNRHFQCCIETTLLII